MAVVAIEHYQKNVAWSVRGSIIQFSQDRDFQKAVEKKVFGDITHFGISRSRNSLPDLTLGE